MAGSMWLLLASAVLSALAHGANQPGGRHGGGDGDSGDSGAAPLAPAPSPPGPPAAILAAGDRVVCFQQAWGCLKCWGDGRSGQLGSGSSSNVGDSEGQMGDNLVELDLGGGGRANLLQPTGSPPRSTLSAGQSTSCAILGNGDVKCWGFYEGLGLEDTITRGKTPDTMGDKLPTVNLGKDQTAVEIDVGVSHTCVVLKSGDAKCWGRNVKGMLGQGIAGDLKYGTRPGDMGDNLRPINVGKGLTLRTIAAGSQHTCALLFDGSPGARGPNHRRVKCWGKGDVGALGQGNNESLGADPSDMGDNLPTIDLGEAPDSVLHNSSNYEFVLGLGAGHGNHNCAVMFTFKLKCWGRNDYGQLGYGDTIDRGNQPEQMGDYLPEVDTAGMVAQVEGGASHTCALLYSGQVYCWGWNLFGQLGLNSTVDQDRPTSPVELGQPATKISVRGDESCAILEDGGVKCWGKNNQGQLGQGDKVHYGSQADHMGNLPAIHVGECDAPPAPPTPTPAPTPEAAGNSLLWPILGVVGVVLSIGVMYYVYSQRAGQTNAEEMQELGS